MKNEINEWILKLTTEFKEKIPREDEDYEELAISFKKYLEDSVQIIMNSNDKFISKEPEAIKSILNRTARRFSMFDIKAIKQTLLEDEAFDSLANKSLNIFQMAKRKAEKKSINVEYDTNYEIGEMKQLLLKVKDYNQDSARNLISEAIVDLKFIEKENSDVVSLRLGQFMREQDEKER